MRGEAGKRLKQVKVEVEKNASLCFISTFAVVFYLYLFLSLPVLNFNLNLF